MACSCFAGLYVHVLGGKENWQKHRTTFSPSILGKLLDILPSTIPFIYK